MTINVDVIIVDNFQISNNSEAVIRLLKTICIEKNIPIIIVYQLSDKLNLNFSDMTIFDLMPILKASLIQDSDLFCAIYKCEKNYKLNILKNRYGVLIERVLN